MTDTSNPAERYDAILGLGSNVGDKTANIARAIALLTERGDIELVARSKLFKTPPWGKTNQDWFVNACIAIATGLAPESLLERCLEVEALMGRRREEHWGPRVIDVDILTYGHVRMSEPHLTIPHPRITERAFVLAPLADIAPDVVLKGQTVAYWLEGMNKSGVEQLAE